MKGNIKRRRFPNFLGNFLTMCIYNGKWGVFNWSYFNLCTNNEGKKEDIFIIENHKYIRVYTMRSLKSFY